MPPTTSRATHYAYENTSTNSPLRKLLSDIFAYNAKPETITEGILSFPAEFLADVLHINMKRLPLRLKDERANFDRDAKKYYVKDEASTRSVQKSRVLEAVPAADLEPPSGSITARVVDPSPLAARKVPKKKILQ